MIGSSISLSKKQQQSNTSLKPNKKSRKSKRSLTDAKKLPSELLKSQSKVLSSTSKASLQPPAKMKSGSSGCNIISGKKYKSSRKRSPTWSKFPNSPNKIVEEVSLTVSTSACRPGTLYSDVLFSAGSSNLVTIKTLTPRRKPSAAQKKANKTQFKCNGAYIDGSHSEPETDEELFPSLIKRNKSSNAMENFKTITTPTQLNTTAPTAPLEDEANLVTLPHSDCAQAKENGCIDDPYGGCLEPLIINLNVEGQDNGNSGWNSDSPSFNNGNSSVETELELEAAATLLPAIPHLVRVASTPFLIQECRSDTAYQVDIPSWNFLDVDDSISNAAYPKFLCHFDDEHYQQSEKIALIGLKLAIGDNVQYGRFKF